MSDMSQNVYSSVYENMVAAGYSDRAASAANAAARNAVQSEIIRMANSPLDSLSLTEAQKQMLIHLGEARKQLQREKTPRCLECVRAIDDVAKEFTGDGEFFHTHGHRIP